MAADPAWPGAVGAAGAERRVLFLSNAAWRLARRALHVRACVRRGTRGARQAPEAGTHEGDARSETAHQLGEPRRALRSNTARARRRGARTGGRQRVSRAFRAV